MDIKIPSIRGKDRLETAERVAIAMIVFGTLILVLGITSTVLTPSGIPAILTLLGAATSFVFTAALIFIWLAKEFKDIKSGAENV